MAPSVRCSPFVQDCFLRSDMAVPTHCLVSNEHWGFYHFLLIILLYSEATVKALSNLLDYLMEESFIFYER